MAKLRLLITEHCAGTCYMCCNKDWNLEKLSVFDGNVMQYDEIIITGGEPFFHPFEVIDLAKSFKIINTGVKVYVYTSYGYSNFGRLVIPEVDGITFSLHNQDEVAKFLLFDNDLHTHFNNVNSSYYDGYLKRKSFRLNVFKGVTVAYSSLMLDWKIKENVEWIKNCPLPKGEVFMRLKILL